MKTIYHIFADNHDDYTDTLKEAKEVYRELKKEGYENIRIYKSFINNEEFVEEFYVQGCGQFPY